MDIRPDYANLEQEDGSFEQVDPDEVEVGSVIVIEPGERVPIDGVIIEGASHPEHRRPSPARACPGNAKTGDEIISGCVNISGLLRVAHHQRVWGSPPSPAFWTWWKIPA